MNAIEKQVILNIFELLREEGLLTLEEANQLKTKTANLQEDHFQTID